MAETKPYKWVSYPNASAVSGEGMSIVFVHEKTGSDYFGNGTRLNPYQTIDRAWRANATKPSTIICVGRFSSNMADGDHKCLIRGDYYGAAVFDGAGQYVLYGFRHQNFIVINTGIGAYDLAVHTGSVLFAGVGGAGNAGGVGNANSVYGVAGSSVLIDNSSLYWGVIGGTSAVKYVGFSRPKVGYYKISLGTYDKNALTHNTIYGCRIENRGRKFTTLVATFASSIFADFDLFADELDVNFHTCLFAADCCWYYNDQSIEGKPLLKIVVDKNNASETHQFIYNADEQTMTVGGGVGAEKVVDIPTAINALYSDMVLADGEPTDTRKRIASTAKKPVFTKCLFTEQTSEQIFNGATKQDFTLNPNGAGIISQYAYYGAFPPALNVPIMDDSTGVASTWDERTADGLVCVQDNEICIDENTDAITGSIMSKIVQINPASVTLAGIFSQYASKFTDYGCALWQPQLLETVVVDGVEQIKEYTAGDVLPLGRYLIKGAIIYEGQNLENKSIVVVSEENTTFANDNVESKLIHLLNANINDVVYVRTLPTIYAKITAVDDLQRGATYLNFGNKPIVYRGRTIAAGESFMAENSTDHFIAPNDEANYEVGVMFDDDRVPSSEWIPAQLFGEYYVCKESGAIKVDADGVPISSGNYLSRIPSSNGGYKDIGRKTTMKHRYIQFKFEIQCVYDNISA